MKRWVLMVCGVCGVVVLMCVASWVGFWVGRKVGRQAESELHTERDVKLHKDLIELDRQFLTNVVTRPNAMVSGRYRIEVRFAGKAESAPEVELEFSKGQLVNVSGLPIQNVVQAGQVVSWEQYGHEEEPSSIFVGTIDGNEMWGRVYLEPGQGWHQGQPPAYGVWRAVPERHD